MKNIPSSPRPRRRQSVFATLTAFLFLLLAIGAPVVFFGWNYVVFKMVSLYTTEKPMQLPTMELSPIEQKDARDRVLREFEIIRAGKTEKALSLSSEELTLLVNRLLKRDIGEQIFSFQIRKGVISTQFSIPMELLPESIRGTDPNYYGRYLNGEGKVSVSLQGEEFIVHLKEFKTKKGSLPEYLIGKIQGRNLGADLLRDARAKRAVNLFSSIAVEDETVVLTPKVPETTISDVG